MRITVYPAREEQGRWRAVWHENSARQQCEAASEEKLAAKLAKVTERLEADAPNMTLRGADLIAYYLSPDRLPAQWQWSRKHAHTQRRLYERSPPRPSARSSARTSRPGTCNRSSTPPRRRGGRPGSRHDLGPGRRGPGRRVPGQPAAGQDALAGRGPPAPPPQVSVAGESALWVDPAEIPAESDIGKLSRALVAGRHGERDELMAVTAAYSGLRWGELTALTTGQINQVGRVITVDRKVVEVAGHLSQPQSRTKIEIEQAQDTDDHPALRLTLVIATATVHADFWHPTGNRVSPVNRPRCCDDHDAMAWPAGPVVAARSGPCPGERFMRRAPGWNGPGSAAGPTALISGVVEASPGCPVERPDRLASPARWVMSGSRPGPLAAGVTASTRTRADGHYSLRLAKGRYVLVAVTRQVVPRCPHVLVAVTSPAPVHANISCDSGIR